MNRQTGDQHWTRRQPDRVRRGTQGNSAKLTDEQVAALCAYYRGGAQQTWLAQKFGISRVTVWRYLKAAGVLQV